MFVCLMTEKELERQGKLYIEHAKIMLRENPKDYTQTEDMIEYIHLPIHGMLVRTDPTLSTLTLYNIAKTRS